MLRIVVATLAFLFVVLAAATAGYGERPDLIEVQTGDDAYQGKVVAHDQSWFWLLQRDGRLRRLRIDSVARFRSISPKFQGFRAADLKTALRREFGTEFEIVSTQHYVVAASPGRAKPLAERFEAVYRSFVTGFGARGFHLDKPEFPLTAVVFPDREKFVNYARQDGVTIATSILGYYHPGSNRVALFDEPHAKLGRNIPAGSGRMPVFARVGGKTTLEETIVHEGTHQVAFNTGLHTRIGPTPRWVVEGLATVFEAPGIRNRSGQRGAKSRMNPVRFERFRVYVAAGRHRGSLRQFIADDSAFSTNIQNFYAEAWALSFFLLETRSQQYSKYLQIVAKRDPLKPCSSAERLADFQRAFGKDLDRLEVDFLRFMAGL